MSVSSINHSKYNLFITNVLRTYSSALNNHFLKLESDPLGHLFSDKLNLMIIFLHVTFHVYE